MSGNPGKESVTARIIFEGVMLACCNRRRQYEVGMVHCPKHAPEITIRKLGGPKKEIAWPAGHDLIFKVINPVTRGVLPHPTLDDRYNFHRVIDMEGFLLHRRRVKIDHKRLQGRRLAVTAGLLYTHALSVDEFDLFTWKDVNEEGRILGHMGTIADKVGLNIQCRDKPGSGIQLLTADDGEEIESMPASGGRRYEICVKNDCSLNGEKRTAPGTDFRFFYTQKFVKSDDGLQLDLGIGVNKRGGPNRSPKACENVFLSRTDTLGLKDETSADA